MRLKEKKTGSLFYGWYVVASAFAILFFNSGARFSFGVIFKPMIGEFGWDRGDFSFAFFLNMTVYALSLISVGKLYDRYGPKWVIVVSTVFLSAGYVLASFIQSLWQFYLCYGIIAAVGIGGTSVTLMAAITSKWFEKWRGAAVSLALSGNCLGQFALVPLFTIFASRYGWRPSYLAIGLIMLVVNMTLALLVIRGHPDDLRQVPYGRQQGEKIQQIRGETSGESFQNLGLRAAMHTRSFWFFLVVMFICGSGDFLVTTHLIPFVTDQGISATTAGNLLAWLGLMSLGGILVAGPVSDLIGNKIPIALVFVLRFLLFVLILKYQNLTYFYVFALLFGFTFFITAPLNTTLVGRLYGLSHLGLISGLVATVHHIGGGLWAYVGGEIFDETGSYRMAFVLSAILALVAVFGAVLIVEKRHRVEL